MAKKIAVAIVVLLVIGVGFYRLTGIASESISLHLRNIGSSIYEYHAATGRWPSRVDDLARTSLPARSPYWKGMIDSGTNVVVWHSDLKPNPGDNANVILAYHNRGLLAWMGRNWVCWGDLRTEYLPSKELRARLQRQ